MTKREAPLFSGGRRQKATDLGLLAGPEDEGSPCDSTASSGGTRKQEKSLYHQLICRHIKHRYYDIIATQEFKETRGGIF